jgi:general stress protein 26
MTCVDDDGRELLQGDAAIAKVRELLPKFRCAMMITHAANEAVHVRPLGLLGDVEHFGGVLWFFADRRSRKVDESADGVPVSLVCQNDDASVYLHLTGSVTTVRDLPKMRELYTPLLRTWFPDGLDDPHLTLIKFDASEGAYWDSPGGTLRLLAAFARSIVTSSPGRGGTHGDLAL